MAEADDDDAVDEDGTLRPIIPAARSLPTRLGRYTLTKRIGFGGMAEVFLAQVDVVDGGRTTTRTCVVKRILPQLAEEPRFLELFRREALIASRLRHPNVVAIDELGETDGTAFLAMEYVDGVALDVLAKTAWAMGRPVPVELACCIVADVAAGLDHAHRLVDDDGKRLGLVHRDVSPDNVMVDRAGNGRLLDFGIAKSALPGDRTHTGEVKGKAPFLSPEQVVGIPLDGRSDLHALGVTLYWLLTGRRPFVADLDLQLLQTIVRDVPRPPIELNPAVPPVVSALVMQLLEKDRERRPSCGAEVRDRLAVALPTRRPIVVPFVADVAAALAANPAVPGASAMAGLAAVLAVPSLWRTSATTASPQSSLAGAPAAIAATSTSAATTSAATMTTPRTTSAAPVTPATATMTRPTLPRAATRPGAAAPAAPRTTTATTTATVATLSTSERAAKGVVIGPMVAQLKRVMKERGLATVPGLSADDLDLIRYERVLATAYYPLDLYHRVTLAAHELGWGGGDDGARQMGIDAANDALRGVYRVFLAEGDPARTLSAAPRIWSIHYRGSTATTTPLGDDAVRIHIRDYGPMPRVLQLINLAWTAECARIAGASDASADGVDGDDGFVAHVRWRQARQARGASPTPAPRRPG